MKGTKDNIQIQKELQAAWLRADITPQQKLMAKRLAKSRGMTFKGWLGQIILKEISQESLHGNS